ncbi:LytR/AlgR family response regulator transcription factor [Flexithrix dorotheae]|uniref:LytR/AlgR family response regulator transcription factor n=1 Tax=Flexithrix dorotheae TaxID=70993 RepID=UPI0003628C8B|nr:response regulator transcription factor [Flexithrix dorotheae]
MKINCIVVDDEPVSRDTLHQYISNCPSLHLVEVCKNAIEASMVLNTKEVHLIFLDINMPKLSGLQFYKSLVNPPTVIFTTAYPEYAVEGFEVEAIDFLLKPFSFERFLKSVNKVSNLLKMAHNKDQNEAFILWKADKKIHKVKIAEIEYLEAVGDYVKVVYGNSSLLVHSTFQNILAQLPSEKIVRIHKSFAIALSKIKIISANKVKLNTTSIPIGQTYRTGFLEFINNNS